MNRRDFYFAQKVTEGELDDAFLQVEEAEKNIKADMFAGANGFLASLVTAVQELAGTARVDFGTGLGWDRDGFRVSNPNASQFVDFTGDEDPLATDPRIVSVYLKFDRKLSDTRLDGLGNNVDFKVDEFFELAKVLGTPAPVPVAPAIDPAEGIILADVTIPPALGIIVNADIDTSRQNLKSDFPVERLKNFTPQIPEGYLGEIKLLNDRITPGTEFQVEFARCADRTGVKILAMDSSLGGLGVSIADGTISLSPGVSGKLPADTALGLGGAAGDWHVFLVGDSTPAGNPDRVLLSQNPGPGGFGGSDLTPFLVGTGYDLYRRIGSLKADGAGFLYSVRKINGVTLYEDTGTAHFAGGGATGVRSPVSTALHIPATAERGLFTAFAHITVTGNELRFYDGAASPFNFWGHRLRIVGLGGGVTVGYQNAEFPLHLGAPPSLDIEWDTSGVAVGSTGVWVRGWVDDLKHV